MAGADVKRETFDPPRPVWLRLRVSSWEDDVEVPALMHSWVGRGIPGARRWTAVVSVPDDVDAPPSWNPRYPNADAEFLRPRDT